MSEILTEWTPTTVQYQATPELCHRCEGSLGDAGSEMWVATTPKGARVPVCPSCAPRMERDNTLSMEKQKQLLVGVAAGEVARITDDPGERYNRSRSFAIGYDAGLSVGTWGHLLDAADRAESIAAAIAAGVAPERLGQVRAV